MSVVRKTHRAYMKSKMNDFTLNGLEGFDIHGKTIGVVGFGKIGQIFANIMKAFGTTVLVSDPFLKEEDAAKAGVEIATLDELYKRSDVISLHVPLLESTKHMINDEAVSKMKDGVVIINVSRGGLIDSRAVIKGLREHKISGVGLDVYENEAAFFFEDRSKAIIGDSDFMTLLQSNFVVMTPHSAFFTAEALEAIATTTLNNFKEYSEGKELTNEVKA
jgi:D-lactate dehydrogenase